jgi:hypothetical protein
LTVTCPTCGRTHHGEAYLRGAGCVDCQTGEAAESPRMFGFNPNVLEVGASWFLFLGVVVGFAGAAATVILLLFQPLFALLVGLQAAVAAFTLVVSSQVLRAVLLIEFRTRGLDPPARGPSPR